MAINPLPPPATPAIDAASAHHLLTALADLQRHLDVLGDDLVAADVSLAGWRGLARDRFRAHLRHDLDGLARVLDGLRRADREVGSMLDAIPTVLDDATTPRSDQAQVRS